MARAKGIFATAFFAVLVACGGPPPSEPATAEKTAAPPSATCRVRLRPNAASPAFAIPRSTIVVQAEVPLAGIKEQLEAKIPKRVAEQHDGDLGIAGRLELTVDRGPFSTRVDGDTFVVETPLFGHAQACAKGSCYAGCDPQARAVAKVPMRLGADYKLHVSEVRIDVTRGCQVRVLGGFVTVDVTPALRARLAEESRRVQASIDRELPDLAPQAKRLWAALGKPRALPLGACAVLAPEEIRQGPASGTTETARLRFGLVARPELRARCGDAPAERPLPALRDDPALPPAGDVHLALVLAPVELAIDQTCGEATVTANGAAWSEPRAVHLVGVEPAAMARAVEGAPIPVPVGAEDLATLLPDIVKGLSDERTSLEATVESSGREGAGLRGADVVALASMRATLTIRARAGARY